MEGITNDKIDRGVGDRRRISYIKLIRISQLTEVDNERPAFTWFIFYVRDVRLTFFVAAQTEFVRV